MITRFEKALQQAAGSETDLQADRDALESRAQKIRRLEELIRAKEVTGDRIVIGIAAALVVSSTALPVYAALYSNGYLYLPNVESSISSTTALVTSRLQSMVPDTSPATDPAPTQKASSRRSKAADAFVHYVIHRATETAALIEGPSGLWWVSPGMTVPGAGRILSIDRSETGWAVVTSEMTITEEMSGRAIR